jgi:CheY-like chemotaxis protein
MPVLSGSALMREVRGIRPSIPLLLVSGNVSVAAAKPSELGGPDAVLKKPVSMFELATCLARVLPN